MSDLGLGITVGFKDQFSRKAKTAGDSAKQLGNEVQGTTKAFKALTAAGVAAFGAKMFKTGAAALGSLSNSAAGFETRMAEVSTLLDTNQVSMKGLGNEVLGMSTKFGLPATEQASAMYQILSAGVGDTAESMKVLEASNKLAIGGVTDVATAADGLTTIMNAWKLNADDASSVTDTLFATMKGGKTTIPELSQFIYQAAPLASQLGVSLEELGGSIIAMTKQGTPTSVAMTQIKAAMTALIRPTEDMEALWKKAGYESGSAAVHALGYQKALDLVTKAAKGNEGVMTKLLGSQEAVLGALQVTGENSQIFNEAMGSMATKAGLTEEAYAKMANTFERRQAKMDAQFELMKITLGNVLLEALVPLIEKLSEYIGIVSDWLAQNPVVAKGLVALIAIFTVLAGVITVVAVAMGVLSLVGAPIIAIILAIGAAIGLVAAVGYHMYYSWQQFSAGLPGFLAKAKEYWQDFKDWFSKLLDGMAEALKTFFTTGALGFLTSNIGALVSKISGNANISVSPKATEDLAVNSVGATDTAYANALTTNRTQTAQAPVNNVVNVPPAKITPADVKIDGKKIAQIVLKQQEQKAVRGGV